MIFDWFFGGIFSSIFHWLMYWGAAVAVIGGCGFLAWWSPIGKELFLGGAVAASVLVGVQQYFVSFAQRDPQICIHPASDPNGPVCQKWHSTDDQRGYGYWEPCDGLQ